MLAEALSAFLAESLSASSSALLLVGLVVVVVAMPSLVASILRRGLPDRRRAVRPLASQLHTGSPRARRSPRQAVSMHRSLIAAPFFLGLGLLLTCFAAALDAVGIQGTLVAIALVSPALLVVLHGRRRSDES